MQVAFIIYEGKNTMEKVKEMILFALTNFWANLKTKVILKSDIVNNLTNSSTDKPLSANQGKALKENINELNENIAKKQDASTAITTGNIGQQSVNYAATAGSATTASTANVVAWGGVSGKPSVYPPSSHNHDDRYYAISSGNGVLNTEYLNSGECYWRKMGRVCYVYAEFIPKKQFEDLCLLFSGLPGAATDQNFFYPAIQADDTVRNGLLRIMTNGEIHEFYYFKTAMGKKTKVGFMYITA